MCIRDRLLLIKSLWIDGYHPKNDLENAVYNEYKTEELNNQNILRYKRIIKLYKLSDEEIDALDFILEYEYKIKLRVYLFGVIPYMEESDYIVQ